MTKDKIPNPFMFINDPPSTSIPVLVEDAVVYPGADPYMDDVMRAMEANIMPETPAAMAADPAPLFLQQATRDIEEILALAAPDIPPQYKVG